MCYISPNPQPKEMAKAKKTLDESSLRAMASLATSSSDLSKLQENLGWNTPAVTEAPPKEPETVIPADFQATAPADEPTELVTDEPNSTPETPDVPEIPVKPTKGATGTSDKRTDKYTNTYLQPIKGFERPTKVAYISKRSHAHITFLQRYAELTGSKVSLQEIMENVFRQHFTEHRAEMDTMRTTLEQKEAELREW